MEGAKKIQAKSGIVALVGRPNVGKSTLMNAFVGSEISVVTFKAQTTRDQIRGILTEKDSGQIIFTDTPGIHHARFGGINERMVKASIQAIQEADLIWYLVDPNSKIEAEQIVIDQFKNRSVALIMTKMDVKANRSKAQFLRKSILSQFTPKASFEISALKKRGLGDLIGWTWKKLPRGEFLYPDAEKEGYLSDRSTRYFVQELIRKQLILQLGDEIPYSCAVEIEDYKELDKLDRIEAMIYVERESQKGMVIGKSGEKIKEIGKESRAEIETLIGKKVFLGLRVKTLKNWTKNKDVLDKWY